MDPLLVGLGIYLVFSVAVLFLNRVAHRAIKQQAERDAKSRGEDPTGAGFAPHAAWDELDTYIARTQSGHPLQ